VVEILRIEEIIIEIVGSPPGCPAFSSSERTNGRRIDSSEPDGVHAPPASIW
jgi:hypothetical protein